MQSKSEQEVAHMASGGDELVKYITEKVVVFIEDPRSSIRSRKEAVKQPWSVTWFGMLPLGWSLWRRRWSRRKKSTLGPMKEHDV